MKSLFYKAKEEGKDLFKCLMIYHNIPLSGGLQSPMQILQSRCTRSGLPMSNTARNQLGLQPEKVRTVYKINICLHMIYTWGKMLCIKMLHASGGIQLQDMVLSIEKHKLT